MMPTKVLHPHELIEQARDFFGIEAEILEIAGTGQKIRPRNIPGYYYNDLGIEAVKEVYRNLRKAVTFDFRSLQYITDKELADSDDLSEELIEMGALVLPFPECYFIFNETNAVFAQQTEPGAPINIISVMVHEPIAGMPHNILMPLGVASQEMGVGKSTIYKTTDSFFKNDIMEKAFLESEGRKSPEVTATCLHAVCLCAAMLLSPHVDAPRISADAKLNAARTKRGKPPINDRYVVKLRNPAAMPRDAMQRFGVKHVDRLSPTPHRRRAHKRTYQGGRQINIPSTWVGPGSENVSEVGKRMYQLVVDQANKHNDKSPNP